MIGKDFIFDGVAIPYTAAEGRAAGWYADFKWTGVTTRNFITPRQDFHGTISNPTFGDGKLISVRGEIFSTVKTERGSGKNIVANLFKIEDFPAEDNELKRLEFTDDDNTDWFIMAKVYTMPEYENERGEPIINFTLQLYAPDPLVLSAALQTASGIYGLWGGITLPVELPIDLSGAINPVTCVNNGNFAAKATITITGEVTNPKIFNLTTGRFFKINTTMTAGDVLIIDTEAASVELNGVNALADRADGSNWLFVNSGTNYFLLTGDNFDYDDQDKATIQIDWYHTKIV
jgi:hypothetical protein